MTVPVDNWGCGEASGGVTQYVDAISTSVNGVITVTTSANSTLGAAASKTLKLTPVNAGGTALTTASIPTQVGGFKCTTTSMAAKYLPGSCR